MQGQGWELLPAESPAGEHLSSHFPQSQTLGNRLSRSTGQMATGERALAPGVCAPGGPVWAPAPAHKEEGLGGGHRVQTSPAAGRQQEGLGVWRPVGGFN